jgi:glycosyltransferase involved in cell wall biosynthesis
VFWPEVRRGTERFVRELADELLARGHEPTLITSHHGARTRTIEDGLEVIRNPRPPDARLDRRMFEQHMTHVPFSYLTLRHGEYDVAHAVYPTDALAAIRWSRHSGGPTVLSYMGVPHHRGIANRRWRPEITMRAFAGVGAVVVLSDAAAAACERWLGVRTRVIAPGVDLRAFTPAGDRDPHPTIVCPAAADVPRKRVGLLVDAFALVRREHPDARLVLSSSATAAGEPSAPGIEHYDLDARERLVDAYRRAWVCALPSLGEAFGLVLAEALACGTPAVGTDDGAIPELIDTPAVGRLFAGSDPGALAVALNEAIELARDPATAAACRARAEQLSTERTAELYIDLYRALGAGA